MISAAAGGRLGANGILAASVLLLIASMAVAVSLGAVSLGPARVIDGLLDRGDTVARQIVWQLRVPRVLVAALVGANLSVAGVLLQGVTRNPLAGPHILGLSAGAGFASITVVVVAPGTPIELIAPAAFLGAIGAFELAARQGRLAGPTAPAGR